MHVCSSGQLNLLNCGEINSERQGFFFSIQKSNGKEYEPDSLSSLARSLTKNLKGFPNIWYQKN